MERYYKIHFLGRESIVIKDYKDFKNLKLSLKLNLDSFVLFLNDEDKQVLINTENITYIEEVRR